MSIVRTIRRDRTAAASGGRKVRGLARASILALSILLQPEALAQDNAANAQPSQESQERPAEGKGSLEGPAKDIELDYKFLKFGLTRKKVISTFGTPKASTEWGTLGVKYQKLGWENDGGVGFVATFLNEKLVRWRRCSDGLAKC